MVFARFGLNSGTVFKEMHEMSIQFQMNKKERV